MYISYTHTKQLMLSVSAFPPWFKILRWICFWNTISLEENFGETPVNNLFTPHRRAVKSINEVWEHSHFSFTLAPPHPLTPEVFLMGAVTNVLMPPRPVHCPFTRPLLRPSGSPEDLWPSSNTSASCAFLCCLVCVPVDTNR